MTTPKTVTEHPELDWIEVDGQAWLTGNVVDPDAPLSQVYVAHIDPMSDVECPRSPHSIRDLSVDMTREQVTIVGEFRCTPGSKKWCSWRGSITDGKWVPA